MSCYRIDWSKRIPGWNRGLKRIWKSPTEFKKGQNTNEKNVNWKGEKASYVAKHTWIKRKLGSPNKCDLCLTTTAKDYQWANKNHKYRRNLNDWIRLCIVCHRKYDKEHNLVDKQIN